MCKNDVTVTLAGRAFSTISGRVTCGKPATTGSQSIGGRCATIRPRQRSTRAPAATATTATSEGGGGRRSILSDSCRVIVCAAAALNSHCETRQCSSVNHVSSQCRLRRTPITTRVERRVTSVNKASAASDACGAIIFVVVYALRHVIRSRRDAFRFH